MGNVIVSLNEEKERRLRDLAKELYGGKKGAISAVVAEGIEELAKKARKLRAAKHQIALMKSGFDLGLKNKEVFKRRSEVYD